MVFSVRAALFLGITCSVDTSANFSASRVDSVQEWVIREVARAELARHCLLSDGRAGLVPYCVGSGMKFAAAARALQGAPWRFKSVLDNVDAVASFSIVYKH